MLSFFEGSFHVNRIRNLVWKKDDIPFFVLFDFILKINSENFISLSALVGKTKSPESVLALASFRK